MKSTKIPFMVIALSLMIAGMAFGLDIPNISTWTQSTGVGGGGPGRGDVLIGALYDVRNLADPNLPAQFQAAHPQQTLISIVNTDPVWGVIARIRFREFKRSHECLDFDIPLTTNDVWVAEVSLNAQGTPVLQTDDRWINNDPNTITLTTPFTAVPISTSFPTGIEFRANQILALEPGVSSVTAIDRCKVGYFELIGEERFITINKLVEPWIISRIPLPCEISTFNCRDVQDVLMGTAYIIRPDIAISHQYNLNALSDFAVDSNGIWASTQTPQPNLRDQVQGELVGGAIVANPGVGGINQLEAILSKRFVLYQYVNGSPAGTPMSTSVVVTFPTKWFHFLDGPTFANIGPALWPFGTPFTGTHETPDDNPLTGGEVVNVKIFDRAENTFTIPGQEPISPGTQLQPGLPKLPWEVNVIGLIPQDPAPVNFRNNVAIATRNAQTNQTFNEGWGWIDLSPNLGFVTSDPRTVTQGEAGITFNFFNNMFPPGPPVPPTPSQYPGAYRGLPAIGIVMTEFFNDAVVGYFGNTVPWQYAVDFGEAPCNSVLACAAFSSTPPNGATPVIIPFGSPTGPLGGGF